MYRRADMKDLTGSVTRYSEPPEDPLDPYSLRKWWHKILRDHGRYSCYAIILALPFDTEVRHYVRKYHRELNLISGKHCLVIGIGKNDFIRFGTDTWGRIVDNQVSQGYSLQIAQLFEIDFTTFPCLVAFEDIRSPDHIIMTLKGMTTQEVAEKMRQLFSIIQKAASENQRPLAAIDNHRNKTELTSAGKAVISTIRNLTGKTFEVAIEAWIKSLTKI
jgi:hypothetical protein